MSPATALLASRRGRMAQGGSARLFAAAACRYWLGVFPAARSAQRRLLGRAEAIPDPRLRADALTAHRDKGSNSEGLAALAVLAPPRHRARLARGLVAYQLILDYLDGVSERPSADPLANGLRLHRAFEAALDPAAGGEDDYYALAVAREDGGYLAELIRMCREPLADLPSYAAVRDALLRQARLCRESQALNHALRFRAVAAELDEWSARTAAADLGLEFEWWELIAAAAASSLCVGALLALAASPDVGADDVLRVESAYFPWASGLNALLDSLVDLDEDPEEASHLRRYESPAQAVERLGAIAAGARRRVAELPDGRLHEAILAAMGSLYLAHAGAWRPGYGDVSLAVYEALGPFARPSLAVHLMRRPGRGGRAALAAARHLRRRR